MRKYLIFLIILLIFTLATVADAAPALSASAVQSRHVVSSGNTSVTVGDVTLNGTLGQPLVGTQDNGHISLSQGFWQTIETIVDWFVYLPLILK